MTDIPLAVGSLQAALDIAKSLVGIRDQAMVQSRVIELNQIILQAQEEATDAREERNNLRRKIYTLEQEIANHNEWRKEAALYELKDMGQGVVLYVRKANDQPNHILCPNCFSVHKKSFVQKTQATRHGEYFIHKCFSCSSEFEFEKRPHYNNQPQSYALDYNPFDNLP
ncbi:MAG: hypothetical protein ACRYFE_13230 [Janthinobacterium lividum]